MNFNDEQFNALAPFEPKFETLQRSHYVSYVGFQNAKRIDAILKAAGIVPANTRINFACADCVKRLVAKAGAAWMADKAEREALAEKIMAAIAEPEAEPKPKKKSSKPKTPKA